MHVRETTDDDDYDDYDDDTHSARLRSQHRNFSVGSVLRGA